LEKISVTRDIGNYYKIPKEVKSTYGLELKNNSSKFSLKV
jgi:hypothetical protein